MSSNKNLLKIIENFSNQSIVVCGDLILDHYIWGEVNRISPEAPVVVVEVAEESKRAGGAGNVVNNLVELGAKVSVCGIVGSDEGGQFLVDTFKASGVDVEGVLVDATRPTTMKTRVIARSQQVVRVDKEQKKEISKDNAQKLSALFESKTRKSKGVVISDYAKGVVTPHLFTGVEKGFADGSFGLGKIPVLIDPKAPNFQFYKRSSIIKPNRKEAEEATGKLIKSRAQAIDVGKELLTLWNTEMVLITLGEKGMALISKDGEIVEVDTVAQEVYDVSGAGDTVSAVFTLALAAGANLQEAATLSNFAAGVVVGEVGTVPITRAQLIDAISE